MAKLKKTNASRLLDQAKISYRLIPYEVDEDDLSVKHVATMVGRPVSHLFKTIILKGDKTGCMACVVPGDCEVNLKAMAKASGNKSVEPLPMKELLPTTGYIRGGCSPIGLKKPMPIFLHRSALGLDLVYISAGQRGLQFEIAPSDLAAFTNATIFDNGSNSDN